LIRKKNKIIIAIKPKKTLQIKSVLLMSLGGQGNNANLPNLAITGNLPLDERRRRWLWIAQQCRNLMSYADQGDNPSNNSAWPDAYRVAVAVLQLLDSLDPERFQPIALPPQPIVHPNFNDTQPMSHNQPPRITTPLPEPQTIHSLYPAHSDVITPKMPSAPGYIEYPMRPPVRNVNPAQNYIYNRSNAPQNTVGPKRNYVQISREEMPHQGHQGKQLPYNPEPPPYSMVTQSQMYTNTEYSPNIPTVRTQQYSDVQYTDPQGIAPVKKKKDKLKSSTSEKKSFEQAAESEHEDEHSIDEKQRET